MTTILLIKYLSPACFHMYVDGFMIKLQVPLPSLIEVLSGDLEQLLDLCLLIKFNVSEMRPV